MLATFPANLNTTHFTILTISRRFTKSHFFCHFTATRLKYHTFLRVRGFVFCTTVTSLQTGSKLQVLAVVKRSRTLFNRLTPNDPYMGRTAPLTSKRCILYIYSKNIGTECFKHALYSPFFSLQNAVCFIMLTCLVPVLFTFYIQDVLKLKKK